MKKSRLVVCPFCDAEQRVLLDTGMVRCKNCGQVFEIEEEFTEHPEEFWHNPDNSAVF